MQNYFLYGIGVLAVTTYAILPVMAKKMQLSIPPFVFMAITMSFLVATSICASFVTERDFHVSSITRSEWMLLIVFGLINFVAFALYLKALSGMPAAHYSLIGNIGPIVTALLALLFIGEAVTVRFFLAIPIVFLGLWLALMK